MDQPIFSPITTRAFDSSPINIDIGSSSMLVCAHGKDADMHILGTDGRYERMLASKGSLQFSVCVGNCGAVLTWDNTIHVFELSTGNDKYCLRAPEGLAFGKIFIAAHQPLLAVGTDIGSVFVWDLTSKQSCAQPCLELQVADFMSCVLGIHQEKLIAIGGSRQQTITVWDINSGKLLHTLNGYPEGVGTDVLFQEDLMVTADGKGIIKVWNLIQGTCLATLDGHPDAIFPPEVWLTSCFLVSGDDRGRLCFWNRSSWSLDYNTEASQAAISYVLGTGIDGHVLVASRDGKVKAWNLDTPADLKYIPVWEFELHDVLHMIFYGKYLATLSSKETEDNKAYHDGPVLFQMWNVDDIDRRCVVSLGLQN